MRFKSILKLTLFSVGIVSFASAASQSETFVAGYNKPGWKEMVRPPVDGPETMMILRALAPTLAPPFPLTIGPLTQELLSQIVPTDRWLNSVGPLNNFYYSYAWFPPQGGQKENKEERSRQPMAYINFDSFFQPLAYTDEQSNQAYSVIQALMGTLKPVEVIDFNTLLSNSGPNAKNMQATLATPSGKNYLAALRAYTVAQTVALTNLLELYTERLPIDSKEKAIAKFQANYGGGPVSALRLEHVMATRRLTDKTWFAKLSKNDSTALQRQMVELLAENLAETYKSRLSIERLVATMSVLITQLNVQLRASVEQSADTLKASSKRT